MVTKTKKPVEKEVVVATKPSTDKQQFQTFIDNLKATNPAAYKKNETELLTKLSKL